MTAARAIAFALASLASTLALPPARAAPQQCNAQSATGQTLLVELYTSEGCNSCPPADRWLSTLKGRPDVLAAAFHVDYWDRLGWVDRFASPRYSERQVAVQRHSGAGFSYTPQVIVDGRDWRAWPQLPAPPARSTVRVELQRDDAQQVRVTVTPQVGAPATLGLWWALLEDGHVSRIGGGENAGATLHHDDVVRRYAVELDWRADAAPSRQWRLVAPRLGEAGHAARLLVVVTDAATGAPLQAVQLDC